MIETDGRERFISNHRGTESTETEKAFSVSSVTLWLMSSTFGFWVCGDVPQERPLKVRAGIR
jgi:hypothetical protein